VPDKLPARYQSARWLHTVKNPDLFEVVKQGLVGRTLLVMNFIVIGVLLDGLLME